jgi:hypothetical protein
MVKVATGAAAKEGQAPITAATAAVKTTFRMRDRDFIFFSFRDRETSRFQEEKRGKSGGCYQGQRINGRRLARRRRAAHA